jgi:histidyl-tRNA synthetase
MITEVMSNIVAPRKPSGFNEYLPGEQIEFNRLLDIIKQVYEKYGFAPLDTPDIELSEVLLAKGGGETEQEVYRFKREGSDTDLTLRYDLTVPLARYVAEHESDLVFPFRRYHIGKVHRAERAQAGRFREFYQCDIDIIGSNSPLVDAEFPVIINEIFERFNFGEFTVRLNNRRILSGFFESLGLSDAVRGVLRIVDKMEKLSRDDITEEFRKIGLNDDQINRVFDFTSIAGSNDDVLQRLNELEVDNDNFKQGVSEITTVVKTLRLMGMPESHFKIDLKIARGLDYYTGTVYETILTDYPQVGSVCSGGRYDNLASYYTKTDLPGVGISIGLTRLFYALKQEGVIKADRHSPARVIVVPISEEQNDYAAQVAGKLHAAEIPAVLYSEVSDLGKKLRYASRMGFSYALVIGQNEAAAGSVSLKNLETREDQTVSVDEVVDKLR